MFDHVQLPPEVDESLAKLKSRIRQYVLWEGLAFAIVAIGLFFWLSLGFDQAVFSVRRLEPPRGVRVAFDLVLLGGVVAITLVLIVFRVFRSFGTKSLALLLERRFPELNDRLVTAIELTDQANGGRQPPGQSALTSAMLDRTVIEAAEMLKRVNVESVFDRAPLRRVLKIGRAHV